MAAEGKVGLMMNVPREHLQMVLALLPSLERRPSRTWPTRTGST